MVVMDTGMTEALEPVHRLVSEILERESRGQKTTGYTNMDVSGVALLYTHVLGSRLVEKLDDQRASIGLAQSISDNFQENIISLTKFASDVDLKAKQTKKKLDK